MRRRIVICWEVREAVNANSCKAESQLGCVTGARLFATEHARHLLHCRPGLEACLGPLPQATRLRASPSRRRDSPRSSTAARPNVLFVGAGSRLGPFAAGGFHTASAGQSRGSGPRSSFRCGCELCNSASRSRAVNKLATCRARLEDPRGSETGFPTAAGIRTRCLPTRNGRDRRRCPGCDGDPPRLPRPAGIRSCPWRASSSHP